MSVSNELHGRIAVVTGASSGIGRHAARVLAARGATEALLARRADRLAALVAEIRGRRRWSPASSRRNCRATSTTAACASGCRTRQTVTWLQPEDIAELVGFVVRLPPRVNLAQVAVLPTQLPV